MGRRPLSIAPLVGILVWGLFTCLAHGGTHGNIYIPGGNGYNLSNTNTADDHWRLNSNTFSPNTWDSYTGGHTVYAWNTAWVLNVNSGGEVLGHMGTTSGADGHLTGTAGTVNVNSGGYAHDLRMSGTLNGNGSAHFSGVNIVRGGIYINDQSVIDSGTELTASLANTGDPYHIYIAGGSPSNGVTVGDGVTLTNENNDIAIFNANVGNNFTADAEKGNIYINGANGRHATFGNISTFNAEGNIIVNVAEDEVTNPANGNYARFGDGATLESEKGSIVVNPNAHFGDGATFDAAKGDIFFIGSSFGHGAEFMALSITHDGANGGDNAVLDSDSFIYIRNSTYGDGATLDADNDIDIIDSHFGEFTQGSTPNIQANGYIHIGTSAFGDHLTMDADHDIQIAGSRFGSDTTITAGHQIVISANTGGTRSSFANDVTLNAGQYIAISETDFGTNAELHAGGVIVLEDVTFGNKALLDAAGTLSLTDTILNGNDHKLTSSGGHIIAVDSWIGGGSVNDTTDLIAGENVELWGTYLGENSTIKAGGDVIIADSDAGNGSTLGTGALINGEGKFTAQGPNTVIKQGFDINVKGDITLSHGVTIESDGDMKTTTGDILISGATVGNDITINNSGNGSIYIGNWSLTDADDVLLDDSLFTSIGSNTHISVDHAGEIYLMGALDSAGDIVHLRIGNDSSVTTGGAGDITMRWVEVTNDVEISTGGAGHIHIEESIIGNNNDIHNGGDGYIYLNDVTVESGNTFTSDGAGFIHIVDGRIDGGNQFATGSSVTDDGYIYISGTDITGSNSFTSSGNGFIHLENLHNMGMGNVITTGGDGYIYLNDVTTHGGQEITTGGEGDIVIVDSSIGGGNEIRTGINNNNEGGNGNIYITGSTMTNGNEFSNGGDGYIFLDDVISIGTGNEFTSQGAGGIYVFGHAADAGNSITELRTRMGENNIFTTGGDGDIAIGWVDMGSGNHFTSGGVGDIYITETTMVNDNEFKNTGDGSIVLADVISIGTGNEFTSQGAGGIYVFGHAADAGNNITELRTRMGENNIFTTGDHGDIAIGWVDMGSGNHFTSGGDGNIYITETTMVNGNEFENTGDGYIFLDNVISVGDNNTFSSQGSGGIFVIGSENQRTRLGNNNDFSAIDNGAIVIDYVDMGGGNTFTLGANGNVDIFNSSFGIENEITVNGDGHIQIYDSQFDVRNTIFVDGAGSIILSNVDTNEYNTIYNTGGGQDLYITDSRLGSNNKIYTEGAANITLLNTTIGAESEIYNSKGGNVYIENVQADRDSVITSSGFAEGANNTWNLVGDDNHIMGTLVADGFNDIINVYDKGYYDVLHNTSGTWDVRIYGGYFDTIRNTSDYDGDSKVTLYNHYNEYGSPDQVIKHIEGSDDQVDSLIIASGTRFTEYEDIAHNNNGFQSSPDAWNAHVTSITNYNNLTIARGSDTQRTGLEIGVFEGDNTDTLLDVETIQLGAYADLFIHGEGIIHNVGSIKTSADSVLWIDRTTLANSDPSSGTMVEIGAGGMITGWNDNAANIVGDLYVYGGGIIKPYSLEHYNQEFLQNTDLLYGEGIYTINAGKGLIVEGSIGLEGSATLASRMFAEYDSWVSVNNGTIAESFQADYLQGTDVTFYGKMEFDPTFGNDNELGAKQMFNLYEGDGTSTENTYYYSIVRSDNEIQWYNPDTGMVESAVGLDPNTLFNNQIIKSDMLGEWYFELNDDGTEVLLRYRLLAKHPTQGGISADMKEPNARNAAEQIDRIRYPFDHDDLAVRYDGDMKKAYRELSQLYPDLYPNYKHYYIEDFEQLLLNIQNVIGSGAALNQAIRNLHPEPYADIASQNLQTMDQFIRTRQQHGMTTLWQVEVENYDEAVRLAEARAARKEGSDSAYASLFGEDEYFCGVEQFVCNPVRWWAAGFGTDGKQKNVGTEYGWDADSWGGAVGLVKEYGDLYLGGTIGYSRVNQEWKDLSATSKTDSFLADAVIGYRIGNGFIEAHGNYGMYEHVINRDVSFSGYTGHARGEYNDQAWGGGLRIGHQQMLGCGWLFVPTIGVNYMQTKSDKFSESGRYNMSVLLDFRKHDIRKRNVRVPVQARLNKSFALGTFVLTPEIRGSITGILGNRQAKATARFVGDPSADGYFTAVGLETGRWAAQVGASLELSRRGRFSLSGNYDYTWSQRSYEHSYSLMAGYNF